MRPCLQKQNNTKKKKKSRFPLQTIRTQFYRKTASNIPLTAIPESRRQRFWVNGRGPLSGSVSAMAHWGCLSHGVQIGPHVLTRKNPATKMKPETVAQGHRTFTVY